jgi:hypothetical protein
VTALGPSELGAARRPFVVLGIALGRLAFGFCLALPLASLVGESGVGFQPDGDRVLFESSGYLLLEVARLQGGHISAAFRGLLPLIGLGLAFSLLCNAALLVALNVSGKLDARRWLTASLARAPGLLLLAGGTALVQGLLLGCGALAASAVPDPLTGARPHDLSVIVIWLCAALLAGAAGGLADIAKAAAVRYQTSLGASLRIALRALRQYPLRACLGWLPFAAAAPLALTCASALTSSLDVSQPGKWRIAAVLLLHQAVILLSVALRATWYARALRVAATSA